MTVFGYTFPLTRALLKQQGIGSSVRYKITFFFFCSHVEVHYHRQRRPNIEKQDRYSNSTALFTQDSLFR